MSVHLLTYSQGTDIELRERQPRGWATGNVFAIKGRCGSVHPSGRAGNSV